MKSYWTPEKTERFEEFWATTMSAAEIAAKLGGGITRNAVLGKAHRMKLAAKGPSASDPEAVAKREKRKEEKEARADQFRQKVCNPVAPEIVTPPGPFAPLNLSFEQIGAFQCRWIGNEDMTAPEFCGHWTVEGKSWCAFHAERARPSQVVSEQELERRRERGRKLGLSRIPSDFRFRAAMPVE